MKITLITGATGGLGRAFAHVYAKNKNNLLLVATKEDALKQLKEEIESTYSVTVDYISADLSEKAQCEKVFSFAQSKGYFVDNLVNNAGFGDRCDFKDMDIDLQLKMVAVNCSALLYFTRVFLTDMLANNEGHIMLKMTNASNEEKIVEVKPLTGIAQGIFMPFGITSDDEVSELRSGGFGSTTK